MASSPAPIFIIEDDSDIREALQTALQLEGYGVETAGNGQEGLTRLKDGLKPGLILLDLMMPLMNGWEFMEERNKDVAISGYPVIVISAATAGAPVQGASAFVRKPIELQNLLDTIQRVMTT